jgi:hypothetical protein
LSLGLNKKSSLSLSLGPALTSQGREHTHRAASHSVGNLTPQPGHTTAAAVLGGVESKSLFTGVDSGDDTGAPPSAIRSPPDVRAYVALAVAKGGGVPVRW